jgi:hypothetical protein
MNYLEALEFREGLWQEGNLGRFMFKIFPLEETGRAWKLSVAKRY